MAALPQAVPADVQEPPAVPVNFTHPLKSRPA